MQQDHLLNQHEQEYVRLINPNSEYHNVKEIFLAKTKKAEYWQISIKKQMFLHQTEMIYQIEHQILSFQCQIQNKNLDL
jgi:hypothetical protein